MTTTNPTTHDRVVQAIQRDAELLDQRAVLKEALQAAKQAEDVLRKSTVHKDIIAAAKTEYEEAVSKAKAVYDAAVAKARVPLEAATKAYEQKVAVAEVGFAKVKEEANAAYEGKAAAEHRTAEIEFATARAMVHRAQEEVAAHQTTIDQHRRQIKERLGLDLQNLMA